MESGKHEHFEIKTIPAHAAALPPVFPSRAILICANRCGQSTKVCATDKKGKWHEKELGSTRNEWD